MPEIEGEYRLGRRLFRTGFVAAALAGIAGIACRGLPFGVSLTVTALVVIVHVLWLERLLESVMSGENPRLRWRDGIKLFGQYIFLAALVALAYLWPSFSPLGAAAGVTVAIGAVGFEGYRAIPGKDK